MIWKILKQEFNYIQLISVIAGMIIGFTIIMLTARFYADIRPSFSAKDIWHGEHLIISKKITSGLTTKQILGNGDKPEFSKKEINELRKQDFIKEIAPFTASNFKATAYTENKKLGRFSTELFFESVPSKYIDLEGTAWHWSTDSDFIPIIIPKSYLNLYNFGFATAQNLPQISEDAAGLITFIINIQGNKKREKFKSHIVGFSDRLNTILVPESFLDYANNKYGTNKPPVSRLILITPDPSDPQLLKYIKEHKYDYNKEQLNNGKARLLLNTITAAVLITGLIISLLALWMFILSSRLLLQKNKFKIQNLLVLGYRRAQILRPFLILNLLTLLLVFSVSLLPYFIIHNAYSEALSNIISTSEINHSTILLAGFLFIFILNSINIYSIYRYIKKLN